jgi:hypothetical protein
MPWDVRQSKRYYYRSERLGDQPVRRYIGTGRAGELAAAGDERRRLEREAAACALAAEEARLREAEAPLLELCAAAHLLARAALVAAGFHQHDRGQWRRRRRRQGPTGQPHAGADPDPQEAADPPQGLGALANLSARAEQGDPLALSELCRALASSSGVWKAPGELAQRVEATLIQRASGTNLLLAECQQRHVRAMKDELGGPSPSPAERLVTESLAASWTWVNYLDCLAAQAEDVSPARVNMLLSLVSAAERRFFGAVRLFTTLRRLLRPPPSSFGLAGRLDRTPPRPVAAARAVAGTIPVTN